MKQRKVPLCVEIGHDWQPVPMVPGYQVCQRAGCAVVRQRVGGQWVEVTRQRGQTCEPVRWPSLWPEGSPGGTRKELDNG